MTEDDTFNTLKRVPYLKMIHILYNYGTTNHISFYHDIPDDFYKSHGWTKIEFSNENYNYIFKKNNYE